MSLRGLMNQTCSLHARRKTNNADGTVSYVYNKIYDNIACRSVHMKTSFGETLGRKATQATHLLYLDVGAPVVDTTMAVLVDGTMFTFEHVEPKYNRNKVHHFECLIYASDSPQTTART